MPETKQILCWFKKRLLAAGGIAGALVAIFVATSHIDKYRWWVWASEFQIVANRVYELTIPEQRRVISSIKRDLERATSVPPAQRDLKDIRKINELEEDLAHEQENLDRLYDERERFSPK